MVIGINDDSPAAARGILAGDIIQKVDQVDIQNSTQILKLKSRIPQLFPK